MHYRLHFSIPLLLVFLLTQSVGHSQTLTQGLLGSVYQQLDNSNVNNNFWSRSLGVGYFNTFLPGSLTEPQSLLHVYSGQTPPPVSGAFNQTETFRTTVASGFDQQWRMERGPLEIARFWHTANNTSFFIQASQPTGHLWLRNSLQDGIKISLTGVAPSLLNGYSLNRVGYGAIGDDALVTSMAINAPWARWHLVHETVNTDPAFGFRPWMRNGVMGTGNSDLFYMGHKYAMTGGTGAEEPDNSNVVAAWGDDELPAGYGHMYDNYTFRYVGTPSAGNSAGSIEGLEIMRLRPFRRNPGDRIEGFVGIGDWVNNAQMPEQRLDVMNGLVRIRQLPTDLEMTGATKAMVVDATGVVGWRTFPTGGGTDCRWALNNVNNLITATTWAGLCVGQDKFVGIGIAGPVAKLHVNHTTANTTGQNFAVVGDIVGTGASATNYGLLGGVSGTGLQQVGVLGQAQGPVNGSSVRGVHGTADLLSGAANAEAIGVYGYANGGSNTSTASSVGVWGWALGGNPSRCWAGYFRGTVGVSGSLLTGVGYTISDASLKTNVDTIADGLALLASLTPKHYEYVTNGTSFELPGGVHYGFLAQEVEATMPGLVKEFTAPAVRDTAGVVVVPEQTVKAINYIEIIPLLVEGIQTLNATVQVQQQQITQLQQDLSLCCNSGVNDGRSMNGANGFGAVETDLRIIPNPVAANTQLRYTVGTPGRVRLELSDGTGRLIEVLEESTRSTGEFTYDWNTQQLSAGTYYCTLFVNDEPLVKKAVKLNER
jgi:hypothetical protein